MPPLDREKKNKNRTSTQQYRILLLWNMPIWERLQSDTQPTKLDELQRHGTSTMPNRRKKPPKRAHQTTNQIGEKN